MKPLKRDVETRPYCGPTAIGVITGKPLSKVLATIRQVRGDNADARKRPVKGMSNWEVIGALKLLGWKVTAKIVFDQAKTLASFLRTRAKSLMNVHLLINVTLHYVVVKGRKFADSYTNGEPVFISKAPHRRKRVKHVWVVEKVA